MKKIWLIGAVVVVVAGYLWYRRSQTTASAPAASAAVAAGSNNFTSFQNFLGQFGQAAGVNSTSAINGAFGNLQSISSAFGAGSTGNGVQVGGNSVQTIASSNGPAVAVDFSDPFGGDGSDDGD